jgi:Ser/Thr protein kinase RdoA (MazF antagonist)
MRQISEKPKLSKDDFLRICYDLGLGNLKKTSSFNKGNINSNYLLQTSKGKFAVRCYNFKSEKEIIMELELLGFLYKKRFFSPKPVSKKVLKIGTKKVCCFGFVEGKYPRNDLGVIKEVAKLTAKLHNLTTHYKKPFQREGESLETIKRYIKWQGHAIANSKFRDGLKFIQFIDTELQNIRFSHMLQRGIVHVDIKRENILQNKKKMTLLDFDNSYSDFIVVDIGSTIMWWCFDNGRLNEKKVKVFLEEYDKIRIISDLEKSFIAEAIRFNLLKQAFKYAYICLPKLKFAEKNAYYFLECYKSFSM